MCHKLCQLAKIKFALPETRIPERYIEGQQGQIETIITEWGKKGTQKMKKERERKREKETDKNQESERHNRVESKT